MKAYKQPHIHGDWRPELKQSIDLTDLYAAIQIKRKQIFPTNFIFKIQQRIDTE